MILRRTQSLCPVCLRRLDAAYVRPEAAPEAVLLEKTCPEHGLFRVPVWRDGGPRRQGAAGSALPVFETWTRPKSPSYPRAPRTPTVYGCPFDCGLCPEHAQHTCTGLLEVTLRCNLACPVCYADGGTATAPPDPDLACLAAQLDVLARASGPCNVQLSGGEPTVREDLPAIVALARARGFGLVQLNTNGLRLAEPGYAQRLQEAGLDSVYLQWDGVSEATFRTLRGRDCLEFKRAAVRACGAAGLGVVLVATVVRGVNDAELGDLLRLALALGPTVRGLHVQPAAFFGRYPWSLGAAPRCTLPEVMAALAAQAPELVNAAQFHPPGCENELCSCSAVYRRTADPDGRPGLQWLGQGGSCCTPAAAGASSAESAPAVSPKALPFVPPSAEEGARKAKQFVALHWKGAGAPAVAVAGQPAAAAPQIPAPHNPDAGRAALAQDSFSRFLAQAGVEQRFTLSSMAFQDALSLDVARVRGCCIHVLRPDGRMIPFCLHNLTAADGTRLYKVGP